MSRSRHRNTRRNLSPVAGTLVITYRMPGLWRLDGELLGAVLATTIGGQHVTLHLPRCAWSIFGICELTAPAVLDPWPAHERVEVSLQEGWGSAVDFDPDARTARAVEVTALALSMAADWDAERAGAWSREHLDAWWQSVTDWIECAGSQISDIAARDIQSSVQDRIAVFEAAGNTLLVPRRDVVVTIGLARGDAAWGEPLVESDFKAAILAAERGDRVAIEYLFLRDARASYRNKEYRKAVLEAGLAAEVVLAEIVEAEVGAAFKNGRKPLCKFTLGELRQVAQDRNLAIPAKMTRDWVEQRNRAAHEPDAVEPHAAKDFLGVVTELVAHFSELWPQDGSHAETEGWTNARG